MIPHGVYKKVTPTRSKNIFLSLKILNQKLKNKIHNYIPETHHAKNIKDLCCT